MAERIAEKIAKGLGFIVAAILALILVWYLDFAFGFNLTLVAVDIVILIVTIFLFVMGAKQRKAAVTQPPECKNCGGKDNVSIDYLNFFMPFDDLKAKYKTCGEKIVMKRSDVGNTEFQNRRIVMMCLFIVGIVNIIIFLVLNGNPIKYFVDAVVIRKVSFFELFYHIIQPFTFAALLFYEYSGCKRWLYDYLNGKIELKGKE